MRKLGLLVLCIVISSPLATANVRSQIANRIERVLRQPLLRGVRVGIDAEILGSRKKVFSYHAATAMIPASNQKLLTSACALINLGSGYRFATRVLGGEIRNKHLQGNLILQGSGDPTWSKAFYANPSKPLIILGQTLKNEGLEEVDGDLVVDDSVFDRQYVGRGWKARYEWEDYAAEVGGLSINNNEVKISVLPDLHIGRSGKVFLYPDNRVLHVVNQTWTAHGRSIISFHRDRFNNQITILGPINVHSRGYYSSFNIHNPPLLVGSAFGQILKRLGIRITGKIRLIGSYEKSRDAGLAPLAKVESPPLLELVRRMNKESDNFLAEHLFRREGASAFGKGSVFNGERAVRHCLAQLGFSRVNLKMVDGSGLSDLNRVSPAVFVDVLQGITQHEDGAVFENTLPRGGVDGTLEDRLSNVNVHAKTGAIRGANSLSGYLKTKQGQTVVFSIILNNFSFSSETARNIIDRIVNILAESPA